MTALGFHQEVYYRALLRLNTARHREAGMRLTPDEVEAFYMALFDDLTREDLIDFLTPPQPPIHHPNIGT